MHVMMEILIAEMAVIQIVKLNLDSHVIKQMDQINAWI